MSVAKRTPVLCGQREGCKCAGKCTGYGTQQICPPLIVLAVIAVSQVVPR